jgi:hypothetical protein
MKGFWAGLLVGVVATYWYFTQGDHMLAIAESLWARATAPSYVHHEP